MAIETVYTVKGMHCASCVALIQKKVSKLPNIASCLVSFSSERAIVTFSNQPIPLDTINSAIGSLGYAFEPYTTVNEPHTHHGGDSEKSTLFEMKIIIPMVIFSFVMMIWDVLGKNAIVPVMSESVYGMAHHLMPIFASFVFFGIGRRYIRAVWIFFKTRTANMDTLVGISTTVAFIYSFAVTAFEKPLSRFVDVSSNFYDVVIVVIGLISLGEFFEARAKRKTNEALQKLAELSSKSALVEKDGIEVETPIENVMIGDIVVVKPNEKIPIDGSVISGNSSVDESNLTGESVPVDKASGAGVFAGTQNFQGIMKIKVEKESKNTALAHIMRIVEDAQNSKAPIERVADKISSIFVYVVIGLAVITCASWLIIAPGILGFAKALALAVSSTMAVLVIACPCSLGLATPTAIITGIGAGARKGILIKNAESLEKLSRVHAIVFDKTGTLTENKLSIEGIFCQDKNHACDEEDARFKRSIIFSMTKSSRHPISQSVAEWLNNSKTQEILMTNITELPGKGVTGIFEGVTYYLGSIGFVSEILKTVPEKIKDNFHNERFVRGRELYLADKKNVLSLIKIHDTVKSTALQEIAKLKKLGLRVIMATGDNKKTGESVAEQLGITEVFTEVKPEDKLSIISSLQKEGLRVAMIGDGVNDSPALAQADVAIGMSDGSDIAIESSDIILLNGDIGKVAEAITLAKKTNRIIWQNLIWSFGYNSVGIPIAAGILFPLYGWTLSPAIAGAIMAFESITVVTNSLRLKNTKL